MRQHGPIKLLNGYSMAASASVNLYTTGGPFIPVRGALGITFAAWDSAAAAGTITLNMAALRCDGAWYESGAPEIATGGDFSLINGVAMGASPLYGRWGINAGQAPYLLITSDAVSFRVVRDATVGTKLVYLWAWVTYPDGQGVPL